jgi:HSP20 family molecular chaperone IbpA
MSNDIETIDPVKSEVADLPGTSATEIRLRPAADVYRGEEGVRILLDVPGAGASDVEVHVHDGILSVEARAERKEAETRLYARSFRVDRRLDVEAIEAELRHGVLTLRLPVHEEAKPRKIEVKAS